MTGIAQAGLNEWIFQFSKGIVNLPFNGIIELQVCEASAKVPVPLPKSSCDSGTCGMSYEWQHYISSSSKCVSKNPVLFTKCNGACRSSNYPLITMADSNSTEVSSLKENHCSCCQPTDYTSVVVPMICTENGVEMETSETLQLINSCKCNTRCPKCAGR